MSNLATIFGNLKTSIIGMKTSDIDKNIDKSLTTISKYTTSIQRNDYIETLKNIVSKVNIADPSTTFLKDIRETRTEFFDRSGRIFRYLEYNQIVRNIAHCSRALNLLTDVIMAPDDINKKSILVSVDESFEQIYDQDDIDKVIRDIENIKRSVNIESYIEKIIKATLKKGDYFVEIVHSPKGEQAFTILSESITSPIIEKEFNIVYYSLSEDGLRKIENEEITKKIIIESDNNNYSFGGPFTGMGSMHIGPNIPTQSTYSGKANIDAKGNTIIGDYSDEDDFKTNFDKKEKDEKDKIDLKDIFITLHDPRYIIRLQTERFKSCLGYLVFPKIDPSKMSTTGNYSLINTDVDSLCLQIIQQLKQSINAGDSFVVDNTDLKNTVMMYLSAIENSEDLKVRYVPPDKMTHFRVNVDVYEPYGESIFDCVLFDCKLFMAMKTAQTIKRLSSSTDKRVIKVETGLPHNAKNLVEMLKENMKKRKISIDKFGSIDTIPSMISTFEDLYVPTRDGKEFVSIDTIKWGGDPQEDIEPLKFIRDNIVANLQVPPAYVGLEENATNRNLLTAENVLFARTIVGYQKQFSLCIHNLFEKIYCLIFPKIDTEILDNITIAFSPPKAALYEHAMEYIENASRAIESLKTHDIPLKYLKKTYLSFLDWDIIEKYQIEDKIERGLKGKGDRDDDSGGGMGGMGGMGGGMY